MELKALPFAHGTNYQELIADLSPAALDAIKFAQPILESLFNLSPYLYEIASKNIDWLIQNIGVDADRVKQGILADIGAAGLSSECESDLSKALRVGKGRMALLAAIAETGRAWHPEESTTALSDLADWSLEACLELLMRLAAKQGKLAVSVEGAMVKNCGLAIFALGKHGGRELNYSSDIDIVAFFDPEAGILNDPYDAPAFYTRIIRHLVGLMEERTEWGYVFRTDLRLRPDPGSTPVALSVDAALAYYEVRGQNWERAAWIKARPCAGDRAVAERFLKDLTPFIWRRHLDFATISDIQAMKRQINIARKVGEARVEGHNVKLGRGGIREVEFFTQTQQLIAGGRDPDLRARPTTKALSALAKSRWITTEAAAELTQAYWYLRAVENRLQMVRDEQTHILPESAADLEAIAVLMGEASVPEFKTRYRATLSVVMEYYAELFIEEESLANDIGDLVFTGSDDDPGTVETLHKMGFDDPVKAAATVRKWHYGSYPATRASAARAHLTEMLPVLLTTISSAGNGDDALVRFDNFLSKFPAGVQLLSLLRNHPHLCRMLVAFMASAPRLAEAVIHRAHVMDGLIDPAFADGVTNTDVLVGKIDEFLGQARGFEDLIDRARIIGQEQKFLISAGCISATVDATRAGAQFTTLAETLMQRLYAACAEEFAVRHGRLPGAQVALLAFGKMASREMTLTSDLDFILLYDVPEGVDESDGARALAPSHYFTRLTQRLVAALSAPTAEGVLYETDMRLRPSGNAGPLATGISGFRRYHAENAWTWEHLALTRARVVAGDAGLTAKVRTIIAETLSRPRDVAATIADVRSMRQLMADKRKPRHPFDLKLATGGLVDIEFVAQSAQLLAGETLSVPQADTATVLRRMAETGLLEEGERLAQIHATYATILQTMSISLVRPFSQANWTKAFRVLLANLTNYPSFERLEEDLADMATFVTAASKIWYDKMAASHAD